MPELDAPVAASRMELKSIDDDEFDEDRSEPNIEDEPISLPLLRAERASSCASELDRV
jgi:hypothetical protein